MKTKHAKEIRLGIRSGNHYAYLAYAHGPELLLKLIATLVTRRGRLSLRAFERTLRRHRIYKLGDNYVWSYSYSEYYLNKMGRK